MLAPLLPAYQTAKSVADVACMIWENRALIMAGAKLVVKAAKMAINALKNKLRGLNGKAFLKAAANAKKAAKAIGKGAKKAAKAIGKGAKKASKAIGKIGKKLFGKKKKSKKSKKSKKKKGLFRRLSQTSVRTKKSSGAAKAKKVLEVMMDIMSHTPWGDKIDAATTIVDFIKDVKDGKRIKVADVFDLTCAINCFLPSGKDLGEFAAKSVKKGFSRAKFAKTIKSIDVKSLKKGAKAAGKKAFKKVEEEAKDLDAKKLRDYIKKYGKQQGQSRFEVERDEHIETGVEAINEDADFDFSS